MKEKKNLKKEVIVKNRRRFPAKKKLENDKFTELTLQVPNFMHDRIREFSQKRELPMSRLALYAIYNELEQSNPFNFEMEMPNSEYIESQYAQQAANLFKLITYFPIGQGLDYLLMLKEEAKIYTKEEFMLAYRELLKSDMIELVYPVEAKTKYHKDYRYVRSARHTIKELKEAKYGPKPNTNRKAIIQEIVTKGNPLNAIGKK